MVVGVKSKYLTNSIAERLPSCQCLTCTMYNLSVTKDRCTCVSVLDQGSHKVF